MSTRKCGCVYADRYNTAAVRRGYEMGGYLKHACPEHKGLSFDNARVNQMKLVPVVHVNSSAYAKSLKLRCCKCQIMHPSTELMADVQSRPFHAYYCNDCITALNFEHNENVINQSIEQEN